MRVITFVFSSLILSQVPVMASEPQERRLFDNYIKYSSQPTPLDVWSQAVSQQTEKVYVIQKGDTLWDVSRVLFGDPEFWPKIWSLNRQMIYNPHEILPQMSLNFYEGTLLAAPTLSTNSVIPPAAAEGMMEKSVITGKFVPMSRKTPVREIPDNLPPLRVTVPPPVPTVPDFTGAAAPEEEPYNVRYMIIEGRIKSLGNVVEFDRMNFLGSTGDVVEVHTDKPLDGDIYSFVEKIKKKTGSGPGYRIYRYLAEAKVKQKVEGVGYLLDIYKSQDAIPEGALLVPGGIPKVPLKGKKADLSERLTLFEEPILTNSVVGGVHNIFFVKGSNLEVGMEIPIYSAPGKESKSFREKAIGRGLIVQVSGPYASLLVLSSTTSVKVGDFAGASTFISAAAAEPAEAEDFGDPESAAPEEEGIDEFNQFDQGTNL